MNKKLLSLLFFFLLVAFSYAQERNPIGPTSNQVDYHFYAGDSLNGFDFAAAQAELNTMNFRGSMAESEKKHYMFHLQSHYVKDKYHIPDNIIPPKRDKAKHIKDLEAEVKAQRAAHVNPHPLAGCNNADFETGDYTGWTGAYGFNAGAIPNGLSMFVNSWTIYSPSGANASVGSCNAHTIVSGGSDPYSGLPMVDPGGGNYACRLGGYNFNLEGGSCGGGYIDPNIAYSPTPPYWIYPPYSYAQTSTTASQGGGFYAGAELLEQQFTVDATNALYTYNYAVILQDGGHPLGDMPYFEVDVFDGAGHVIPCLQYYQECTSGSPPSGYSTVAAGVYSSGWQSNTLDLSGFAGQTISIYFSAAGCSHGGHFGYAYIDGSCGPKQLNVSTPAACIGSTMTVTAPPSPTGTTFSWTGPGIVGSTTGSVITINASGTYTVTVTPGNGCSYTVSTLATFAVPATITPSSSNVTCVGSGNGTATASASGGNAPYTYNWTGAGYGGGGQGSATATGLGSGTYTCTVTTANGCSASHTYTISNPSALSITPTQANVNCNGSANGTATATASGGTGAITYTWAPAPGGGQGTNTATGLAGATTYTCTIHDANGCPKAQTFAITQPSALSIVPTQANVSCFGGSNATATATSSGGTGAITYTWAPVPGGGQGTNTATGLSGPATYTCTIHDANGCPKAQTFAITQPGTSPSITPTQANVNCNGSNNGTATATASGGTAGYTYTWAPAPGGGQGTATATGLVGATTYTCTVHDANNCPVAQTFAITQPSALAIAPSQNNVTCNGNNNGTATASASGGTGAITYTWAPAPGGGQGTNSANGLVGGTTYTCTIHDANGCPLSHTFNIVQPGPLTTTATQLNESCSGNSTASATVTPSGGTPAYIYVWTPSGGNSATASNLSAGTYTCTVTDSHNCPHPQVINITQPPVISITPSSTTTGCGISTGTANAVVSGGTGAFTYTWAPAPGGGQGTSTATGLGGGTYTLTVHDANACPQTSFYTITSAGGPSVSIASQAPAKCSASCDGSATVAPSGGTGAYTYSWSPSGGTGISASGLCANTTYVCTITDANNCVTSQNVTIGAPVALSANPTQTSALCTGGSSGTASVTVSGGTTGYTYAWTGGVIGGGQTASTATGLAAGTYTCNITDANGCTTSASIAVTEPASALSLTPSSTNTGCGIATGTATVTASGGTGADTYTWSPAPGGGQGTPTATGLASGAYTVTVNDANNCAQSTTYNIVSAGGPSASIASQAPALCNASCDGSATVAASGGAGTYTYSWSPIGGTAATATALCANTSYTCFVTDNNNCVTSQVVTIAAPAVLSAAPSQTSVNCKGGSSGTASVAVSGGTIGYTYNWTGGVIGGGQTAVTATGLAAGTYTCNITDANGCTTSSTVSVTQPISSLSMVPASTQTGCGTSTGTASVTASGGTGADTYNWTPAPGGGQGTNSVTGLAAGSYTVTVQDANGCTLDSLISISSAGAPSVSIASNNAALCNASCNGSATVNATGGTAPFAYSWSGGGGNAATASSLCAGTYVCTVTDASNCVSTQSVIIAQPAVLSITSAQANALCNGGNTGSATATVAGGTSAYTYSWTPSGGSAQTASGLAAGTYTCNVTDANGCTTSHIYTITQPTPLAIVSSQTNASCNGSSNGSGTATVSGGTAIYTYNWTPSGGSGATASGLSAGNYTCTVTDQNGCTLPQVFTVTQPAVLAVTAAPTAATCGQADGSASATPSGGTSGYTWSWLPSGGNTANATTLTPGVYTCNVIDAHGCTASVTTTILNTGNKPVPTISTNGGNTNFCAGTNVILSAGGGGTYSWSTGSTSDSITVNTAGVYVVYVTNACGTDSTTIAMSVLPKPSPTITGQSGMCNGDSVQLTANGGGPYLWSTGSSNASIWVHSTGNYSVSATNGCGTTASANFPVTVNTVNANFIPSTLSGTPPLYVGFTDSSSATATTWSWNYGDGNTANGQNGANDLYTVPGTYTVLLTVTNASGCTSTHSVVIDVSEIKSFISAPNIFTPNGDGINDDWHVNYAGIDYFDCKIYDRWGVAMAQLIAPGVAWDGHTMAGEVCSNGTYFYVIHAKGDDGVVYDMQGFITLVRTQ